MAPPLAREPRNAAGMTARPPPPYGVPCGYASSKDASSVISSIGKTSTAATGNAAATAVGTAAVAKAAHAQHQQGGMCEVTRGIPRAPVTWLHGSELLVPVLECALLERIKRATAPAPRPYGISPPPVVTVPRGVPLSRYEHKQQQLFPQQQHAPALFDGEYADGKVAKSAAGRTAAGETTSPDAPAVAGPTPFHALEAPSISPSDYLVRLTRYSFCSRSVFVAAFVYLDRVAALYPILAPTPLNVHRLLVTTVLLATKSFDDILYDNAHFAKVGGLDLAELNALELDMLHRLSFRMHITHEEFAKFEQKLVKSVLQTPDPAQRDLVSALGKLAPYSVMDQPSSPIAVNHETRRETVEPQVPAGYPAATSRYSGRKPVPN
jgi:hypothetical protein